MSFRRLVLILTILAIALAILGSGHYYIAARLILAPELPRALRMALLGFLALLAIAIPLRIIGYRMLPPIAYRLLTWPTYIWLGLCFLLITLLATTDALLALSSAFLGGILSTPTQAWLQAPATQALFVSGFGLLIAARGVYSALGVPPIKRVSVELEKWPQALNGFRVLQLSDVHLGPILGEKFAVSLVAAVNAQRPDMIVITGDLVDDRVERLERESAPLASLKAKYGAFFVTGNHDHYASADAWCARLTELGIQCLRNRRVTIGEEEAVFDLSGVDDHRGSIAGGSEDFDAALKGRDTSRPVILLAHDPTAFKTALKYEIDLQLSGHSHGGQIWPFTFFVKLALGYVAGLYRRGASQLYVSRGTGFWGPPLRLFAPAEVTIIEIAGARSRRAERYF
jgi:uncharacterized protein